MEKPKERILLVDDTIDICRLLEKFLSTKGYEVQYVTKGKDAMELLYDTEYDLVISDYRLPDFDGLDVLKYTKDRHPDTSFIMITGYSDVSVAVNAIKNGAHDYVAKPLLHEEVYMSIQEALKHRRERVNLRNSIGKKPAQEVSETLPIPQQNKAHNPATLSSQGSTSVSFGNSKEAQKIQELINVVAPTDMSVLITGETGTGKEYVARAIHELSNRSKQPFVAIDCGALPNETAGSELFGHVKGAFTGALMERAGMFELAQGGTLFLDEVGNLNYDNQLKLLRALQERKIRRMGGSKEIDVDVRVLAATNDNLNPSAEENTFRKDLFFRLNELEIKLLPLRERKEDIFFYADLFMQEASKALNKQVSEISSDAQKLISHYSWPGNLREMRNIIKRAVLFASGNSLEAKNLPIELSQDSSMAMTINQVDGKDAKDLKAVAAAAERQAILLALRETEFNKTKTAELLNVDRKTLYNKMKSYGLTEE